MLSYDSINLLARVFRFKKQILFVAITVLVASVASYCEYVLHQARRAVAACSRLVELSNSIQISTFAIRPTSSHFEHVGSSAGFESAAEFAGDLYVSTGPSLYRYSAGKLLQSWRAGGELPPTRLSKLCVRTGIEVPELWIATSDAGVLIYNGNSFRQLLPADRALCDISAMLPLPSGRVILGTRNRGVYFSDGSSLRSFHPAFSKLQVTALEGDEDQLWVGTRLDGAWYWRGGEAHHLTAELPDNQVLSIAVRGDTAWVGTPVGVAEFKGGVLSRRLANGIFAQALAESDDRLWIGTVDQGAFSVPLVKERPRPNIVVEREDGGSIVSFARVRDSLIAIRPSDIVDPKTKRSVAQPPDATLASNHVTAIHADPRGRLWVGYFDRGLDAFGPSDPGSVAHFEDDTLFCINRIKEDPRDGSVFVATANGLAIFDASGKLRQVLTRESGLISSNVTDMLFESPAPGARVLTVATPAGLTTIDRGAFSSIYAFHGLVNNHIFTLAEQDGTLFAGTLGGVSTLRRGLVEASFTTANSSLRQNWITASAVFGGRLYLGTYGSGVVEFNRSGSVRSFPAFAGYRCEVNLNAFLATGRALYAGTAAQGLAVLPATDERWQFVTAGLPSLNITALEEHAGRLYVGTDNGLVQISENNLLP